jgi:hypothetical protein
MTTPIQVFVDSSALVALLDSQQTMHQMAKQAWSHLLSDEFQPITSNYVLLETCSLVQRRSGVGSVSALNRELVPVLEVVWVNRELHDAGLSAVLAASERDLGLVDCVSFEIMRRERTQYAFAFDRHFEERGYSLPPLSQP